MELQDFPWGCLCIEETAKDFARQPATGKKNMYLLNWRYHMQDLCKA